VDSIAGLVYFRIEVVSRFGESQSGCLDSILTSGASASLLGLLSFVWVTLWEWKARCNGAVGLPDYHCENMSQENIECDPEHLSWSHPSR
jgi:hypothetical protein